MVAGSAGVEKYASFYRVRRHRARRSGDVRDGVISEGQVLAFWLIYSCSDPVYHSWDKIGIRTPHVEDKLAVDGPNSSNKKPGTRPGFLLLANLSVCPATCPTEQSQRGTKQPDGRRYWYDLVLKIYLQVVAGLRVVSRLSDAEDERIDIRHDVEIRNY